MWSRGSPQAVHRQSDLHAVEPKRDSSSVAGEPQCGQRTDRRSGTIPGRAAGPAGPGGAMPAAASRSRPAGLIMSVLQAGDSTVRTSTSVAPAAVAATATSARITSIAGQPEYVGEIVTVARPAASTSTPRRMPSSSTVTTRISGSTTAATAVRIATGSTTVGAGAGGPLTTSLRGARGATPASRP